MASTEFTLAAWLFDGSKVLASFVSGIGLLVLKDYVESRSRRRRVRKATWKVMTTYASCRATCDDIVNFSVAVFDGQKTMLDAAFTGVNAADHLANDLISLDHQNAAAYVEAANVSAVTAMTLVRWQALEGIDTTRRDGHEALRAATVRMVRLQGMLARARLRVLRVLQDCAETDEERGRVLSAAEADVRECDEFLGKRLANILERIARPAVLDVTEVPRPAQQGQEGER